MIRKREVVTDPSLLAFVRGLRTKPEANTGINPFWAEIVDSLQGIDFSNLNLEEAITSLNSMPKTGYCFADLPVDLKGVGKDPEYGASLTGCCYAAILGRFSTFRGEDFEIFSNSRMRAIIASRKISRKVRALVARSACMAGVLVTLPNFNAL